MNRILAIGILLLYDKYEKYEIDNFLSCSDSMEEEPMIGSAKVGSRGQIVLPVDIRNKLNINEGDTLIVIARPGHNSHGISLMKASQMASFLDHMEGTSSKIRSLIRKEE